MEDQQPAAGDLKQIPGDDQTEAAAATQTDETKSEETAESTAAAETAEDEAAQADSDSASEVATESPKVAKRRKKRNWAAALAALAAVVFVGSAAFAGWAVQPYLTDRAVAATKLKVARTAADAITALWTYTPENMDNLADRAAAYLSGDFGAQYRKFVDAIVAPNKQAKITNSTVVTGVAVETLEDPNAVVMVYTNTTSTSPLTKNIPSLKYLSYRLFMKRDDSHWLVTRMTTITSLDLTPHL
ncbi:Mce associated membrane protein [Mycobacterium kubicae]|uniref:Mammalian cell entry protein n=1 Tax=Mycobacterium kubicae TaxID=120959 RepID=A0AAX1JA88_9MYCO|nr:mammalian cell entry protein [Mycobacterium kubicae]MCV7097818.1 mammalian cell entry protein [Mycobacterium kubicae]ORW06068.1 mammalian cell entry protein [Mycobacterium kubicae]QNI10219.1 mammalian cell entry protein [Mycobacterium kubicae]QPI38424.1 mammalian cell entry protein [Mycobacterium kubicae]GFG62833.1 Mce associated membrane protein [Mycobacterium kubicae]